MSSVYNLEPQPTAKVILKTTAGDILLEIFGKQTPLASKNFLQHCYDGYYNNTIFHRLVPGFIIQGGDPTGTGTGGVSSSVVSDGEGEYFQDEFHSRLKFNRRGLLGMANEGKEGTNGSQFFLTLAATPELQGRNTMFGRVEGDTIYNLMKMADAEVVEGTERPLYPTQIIGAEVLVIPFEDVFARVKEAPRVRVLPGDGGKKEVKKRKKAAGKNVLSFGGDEDGDVEMTAPVLKKVKANPKLVVVENDVDDEPAQNATKEKKPEKPRRRRTPSPSPEPATELLPPKEAAAPRKPTEDDSRSSSSPERAPAATKTTLEKTNAEISALKASMKRNTESKPEKTAKPKNALEAMIPATSTKGRKRGKATDDKGAMIFFNAWKARLESAPDAPSSAPAFGDSKANGHASDLEPTAAPDAENDDDEAALCDLHFIANCQSCKSWDDDGVKPDGEAEVDGEDDPGWMSHRLTAAKDTLGKDLEWKRKMEEVEVIDPREKARSIKEERKKERDGGRMKA